MNNLAVDVSIMAFDAAVATFVILVVCTFLWAASQMVWLVVKSVMDR